jgi:hypothetical protein
MDYDSMIRCLVLVHLGQQLGAETPLARAVFQLFFAVLDFPA